MAHPEDRLLEADLDLDEGIPTALSARCGTPARGPSHCRAEEGLEDVLEAKARACAAARGTRVDAPIELGPLVGVTEHLIGGRDLLEALLALWTRHVGMQLPRELAVCLLDLRLGRVSRHA